MTEPARQEREAKAEALRWECMNIDLTDTQRESLNNLRHEPAAWVMNYLFGPEGWYMLLPEGAKMTEETGENVGAVLVTQRCSLIVMLTNRDGLRRQFVV